MALAFSLFLALAAPAGAALRQEGDALVFGNGVVELRLDAATGTWRSFSPAGQGPVLGCGGAAAGAVVIQTPAGWSAADAPSRHVSHRVEPAGAEQILAVTRRQGDWEITERYGLRPGVDLLSRSADLAWRGGKPVEVSTVRLSLLGARVGAAADCRTLSVDAFPPRIVPYATLRPGHSTWVPGDGTGAVVVHNAMLRRGVSAARLCLTDASGGAVVERDGTVEIHHDFFASQMAEPGRAFHVGTQYLRVSQGDLDAALAALQGVFSLTGVGMPADSPADAPACVIYSAHPGGTIDSGFRDGGGFRGFAGRVPALAELGFNTFWMLPFWHGHVYAPVAYDRLDERLGTEGDLRALVETAHRHGARVLGDLIPHGPRPESGLEKTHPEWISRDRDGAFRHMWGCYDCDYAHPGWRRFMAEHAADWVRRVGLDGYRVDVAGGQQENWRPAEGNRTGNSRTGGIGMLREVRAALHREKPSAVLLAEGTHPGLWLGNDMVYDFPFTYRVAPKALEMPAAEFVPAMRRWLQWQRAALPDGALPMRYVESHDTVRARLRYGPGLHRAFLALIGTIQGVPMLYDGQETGCEPFLRALFAARRAHPALTRGAADYQAVETGAPEVFAVLRTLPSDVAVVAINFGGRPRDVVLSLHLSRLPARLAAGPWHDALGSKATARVEGTHLRLRATLPPYGSVLFVPGAPAAVQPAVGHGGTAAAVGPGGVSQPGGSTPTVARPEGAPGAAVLPGRQEATAPAGQAGPAASVGQAGPAAPARPDGTTAAVGAGGADRPSGATRAPSSGAPAPMPPRPAVDATGCVEHLSRHYRLLVDRRTGLLRALVAPDGTPLLSDMALREGPRRLCPGTDPLDWSAATARFSEEAGAGRRVLSFAGAFAGANGMPAVEYVLRYRSETGPVLQVELALTARQAITDVNGALRQSLRLPAGGEWFAETLEGPLRGEVGARRDDGEPHASGRYWHRLPWALWEDCLLPLAGGFGMRAPGGYGVAIHGVSASLPGWRQNAALRGPVAGDQEPPACRAELAWLDGKAPVSLRAGETVTFSFRLTVLAPGQEPPAADAQPGPRLAVDGARYTVENDHYRATFVRSRGGGLMDLSPRKGASLLRDSVVYSDRGLYGPARNPAGVEHPLHATGSEDVEPDMSLERHEGRLAVTVTGTLRHAAEGQGSVVRPLTRTRIRYTFDAGAEVGVEVSLLPPAPTEASVFLAQRLILGGVRRWWAGERELAASERSADRVWQSRETPLPAGAGVRFAGAQGTLSVSGLELPAEFANLFVFDSGGGNLTLFLALNDSTPVAERRWLTFRYRLRAQ